MSKILNRLFIIIVSTLFLTSVKAEENLKFNTIDYKDNNIYFVKFTLNNHKIKIIKSMNKTIGKDYLSTIAKNHTLALNGGYFYADDRPTGILKIKNQLFALGRNRQAVIGWKKDGSEAVIDIIKPDLKLFINKSCKNSKIQ